MWGGTVAAPGAIVDPASAERAARAFLAEHLVLLAPGAAPGDFVVVSNQLDGELRTVGFAQTWRGLPVIGGQLGFVFGRDRLFAIGSEAVPHLAVATPSSRASAAAMRGRAQAAWAHHSGTTRPVFDARPVWRAVRSRARSAHRRDPTLSGLLPLDRARRLARDVVDDAVDAADLVDHARGASRRTLYCSS
jgi:hypothetical protein